jgi:hypothetical protein
MERVKKSNGIELMYPPFHSVNQFRQYNEYLNQQRKIMEAQSSIAKMVPGHSENYQKVRYEMQYEFHRIKQRR